MLAVSHQFGICWDEPIQIDYGKKVLKFYSSGFKDTSYINQEKLMHLYGGVIEVMSAIAYKIVVGDEYNVHHFITAFFGFLALLFTGLTAKLLNGWRSALFALWFIFLTPVFFGHSMYNSKDIPFAASYIISIYFLIKFIREYPSPSLKTIIFLIAGIALSINIRIGGILLMAYLVLFAIAKIIYLFSVNNQLDEEQIKKIKKSFKTLFVILLLGYLFGLVFWPYGLTNPFTHPLNALQQMANYEAFDSYNLFESHWIHKWEIPWYYIPKWIYITTPLFISASFVIAPLLFILNLIHKKTNTNLFSDTNNDNASTPSPLERAGERWFFLVLFTALFPVFYIIIKKSNVYDGWRHALFVYPSLVVCVAAMWDKLLYYLKNIQSYFYYAAWGFLLLFVLDPLLFMAKNHPFESFYFSPTIGGINGAFKNYEIDYYGTSIKQAVEWIAENTDSNTSTPIRVRCWYGENESCEHFTNKYKYLKYVRAADATFDWDYSIVLPVQAKADPALFNNWPPLGEVYEKDINGTPVFAIVKNPLIYAANNGLDQVKQNPNTSTDANELVNNSLLLYNNKDYLGCIQACEKAISIDSNNAIAYNNICSSLNNLALYEDAINAGEKAIKINPAFDLAKGNVQLAKTLLKEKFDALVKANQYVNLSVVYYNIGQYERCIYYCKKSLQLIPDNAIAYNNICSCYNVMGNYTKAKEACEQALKINPNFDLAKNNLNLAVQSLDKK